MTLGGSNIFLLERSHGDRGERGGSRGRAGGEIQQEATLWVVEVQRLGAVFATDGMLPFPDGVRNLSISRRRECLRRNGGHLLGEDAWGQLDGVWDDRVAALQGPPGGSGGGFGCRGGTAGQRGGGAGGGEVSQKRSSDRGFSSLDEIWRLKRSNWPVSSQLDGTEPWKRRKDEKMMQK